MTEASINPTQLCRRAFIYVRQSTLAQVQRNRESTRRQYELADRARSLGWSPDQVEIIDEDLGQSGASSAERTGFARLTAEVALGQADIRHPDRRCQRHLPSAPTQRSAHLGHLMYCPT